MRTHNGMSLLALVLLCAVSAAGSAAAHATFEHDLLAADKLRSSDPEQFATFLDRLDTMRKEATAPQLQRLQYLRAYEAVVYRNQPHQGIVQARAVFNEAKELNLKFRAGSLLVNSYAITRDFTQGLRYLNHTLPMRVSVQDKDVRHDGIYAAALLYNQLGQYKLGLQYAEEVLKDNPNPRARCVAGISQVESQYRLGILAAEDAPIYQHIDQCLAIGEKLAANFIRVVLARKWAARGEGENAIALLEKHLAEVQAIGYHVLIAEMHALLAELYLGKGKLALAQRHADATVAQVEYLASSIFLATAYNVLYEVAERQRQPIAALAFYRRYAEADRAHLTDVNARELAYQIVREETLQKTQQIELLNGQNQVLRLQQRVDKQARQNTQLLVVLLTFLVAGIGYWAYKIKRVQISLRRFAETDALTDISNRHHFTQRAEQALAQSAKDGEPCALVMFDLDHFKVINDSYGHVTGDWVLQQVAKTCKGHCRRIDHLGRLGGEEFAILLHGGDLRAATRLAEDCRVKLTQIDTRGSGYTFVVTASFGVSATPLSGYSLAKLLSNADQMLYSAKRAGRNRVHVYSGESLTPPQLQVVSRNDEVSAKRIDAFSPEDVEESVRS